MNVSTDMRRDESLDALKRPGAYAYAYAPGAGGFFELLTRLNTGPELRATEPTPDTPPIDAAQATDDPAPASAEDPKRAASTQDADTASEDPAGADDTADPAGAPDALRTPADSESAESGDTTTDGNAPTTEVAGELTDVIADTAQVPVAPDSGAQPPEAQPAHGEPGAIHAAPLLQAGAPTNTPAPPVRPPATPSETATGAALAAEMEVEVDPAPDDAPPPLPKTLNALLAQSVLREMAPRDTAPPILEPETAPDMPRETGAAAPAEETPLPAPTPRAGAMDIAGVRADTTAPPRIPLANLPGELVQQVHLMQQEGARSMRLRIVPEHLGELRIEIHGAGDTLRVRMIAASATVRDALDSQMADLRQAFQKQGLNLNNVTVDAGAGGRESPYRQDTAPRYIPGAREELPAPETGPRAEVHAASPASGATALNILA